MIFSENRFPPRIKSGAGFFGIMLWMAQALAEFRLPVAGANAKPQDMLLRLWHFSDDEIKHCPEKVGRGFPNSEACFHARLLRCCNRVDDSLTAAKQRRRTHP